jgi:hypothetical protein
VGRANGEDDNEDRPFSTPLPKDDRLWRHPSELDDKTALFAEAPRLRVLWRRVRKPAS